MPVPSPALSAHGCDLGQAGVEAAEQIGRCERHGGILTGNICKVIAACHIRGKAALKLRVATCVPARNELVRHGGIAAQWVLGKFPRGVGHMLEEEEIGQLGMPDNAAEFGLKAVCRFESMKAFIKRDCSSRVARTMLRQAGPVDKEYKVGDLVVYRKAEETKWHGPCRVIGFDSKVMWNSIRGHPLPLPPAVPGLRTSRRSLRTWSLATRFQRRQSTSSWPRASSRALWDVSGRRRAHDCRTTQCSRAKHLPDDVVRSRRTRQDHLQRVRSRFGLKESRALATLHRDTWSSSTHLWSWHGCDATLELAPTQSCG